MDQAREEHVLGDDFGLGDHGVHRLQDAFGGVGLGDVAVDVGEVRRRPSGHGGEQLLHEIAVQRVGVGDGRAALLLELGDERGADVALVRVAGVAPEDDGVGGGGGGAAAAGCAAALLDADAETATLTPLSWRYLMGTSRRRWTPWSRRCWRSLASWRWPMMRSPSMARS